MCPPYFVFFFVPHHSHWDMLNYLPAPLRHPFDFVVATFLADHLREGRNRKQERQKRLEELGSRLLDGNAMVSKNALCW